MSTEPLATHILVLNYDGESLLEECLPSVLDAAAHAPFPCSVTVIDNASRDASLSVLARNWPQVPVISEPNRGLASFNHVLARMTDDVVLLLNNDVKLDRHSVGPLVHAVRQHPDALFAAPQCWTFDGQSYEGMRTRVRSRFGLVQGLCRVPGHEQHVAEPGLTASAGPVLAVHRERFLALGGYDPLYFPGRIEDLDLGFRGWMKGWKGYYVPESLAYHKGFGSFAPAFGRAGCDRLALRNTLLFAWKNLRGARLVSHFGWLTVRLTQALAFGRWEVFKAFGEALQRIPQIQSVTTPGWTTRQESFFREFRW